MFVGIRAGNLTIEIATLKINVLNITFFIASAFVIVSVQKSNNGVFSGVEAHKNSAGSPVAKTGAPGDGTCVQCHAGSVLAGDAQNILKVFEAGNEVSAYMPGVTYQVSLSLATGNVKEGFGSTALLSNNTAAGLVPGTGLVGTQVSTSGGRDYVTHRVGSSNEGNVSWDWDWTAPDTESGPVTFYVASNKANGNNASSGDQIFVSQHVIQSVLGVEEKLIELQFSTGYSSSDNSLNIRFVALTNESAFINLVDLTGKSVFSKPLGNSNIGMNEHSIQLNKSLHHGTYIVQLFVGNKVRTKKIAL